MMKIVPKHPTKEQKLNGARSIGKTITVPNHIERAADCYETMIAESPCSGAVSSEAAAAAVEAIIEMCGSFSEEIVRTVIETIGLELS